MALTKVIGAGLGAVTQDGAAVFNEASADVDFRVESNGDANMLFVDGGTDRVGMGTATPASTVHVRSAHPNFKIETTGTVASGGTVYNTLRDSTGSDVFLNGFAGLANCYQFATIFANGFMRFLTGNQTEAMRIDSSGNVLVGTTDAGAAQNNVAGGISLKPSGQMEVNGNNTQAALFGRTTDGRVIDIYSAGTREGSIDVSGTTVSYNGGHLSRWSRLVGGGQPNTILRGTVMSNLDAMLEWADEDNEQLNHTKVSDVEGDVNVAGVFQSWDIEDDFDDYYLSMTGDFVIRIAQGTTVARGDLLMSAGDGTAKTQDDDIVRSKTIAKVTSTNVSHTYDDGTYLVPCVLMAC